MNWDRNLQKKWITASLSTEMRFEKNFINMCALIARTARGDFLGFTIFEPRDLNEAFFKRLKLRTEAVELSEARFELFFPQFLAHRVNALMLEFQFSQMKLITTSFLALKYELGHLHIRSRLRIVNVDDSPALLKLLAHVFSSTGWIDVVGQVAKSTEAVENILRLNPDVVTLDMQMPEKNGVEVLKDLLAERHFLVLIISSLNLEEGSLVFEALNSGAFDYIQKPQFEEREAFKEEVLNKALLAVEGRDAHASLKKMPLKKASLSLVGTQIPSNLLWCIGSSTGGTQALTRVFTSLPHEIPPTLIVQHIPPVYSKSFADSLNELVPFTVKEAAHGDILKQSHVYIAPGGKQMSLEKVGLNYRIVISDDPPVNRFKPSVDYLFKHLSKLDDLSFVAGILTGMGRDGAEGLLELKRARASTFAQDESSSTVYGMPRAAFELGAVDTVCHIDQVAQFLMKQSQKPHKLAR